MVHQLEVSVDAEQESTDTALGVGPLPSGDELAAELERFLRDQGSEAGAGRGSCRSPC